MPGQKARVAIAQKGARELDPALVLALGGLPDAQYGDGVDRRLAQTAGVRRRGSVRGEGGRAPALRIGEVAPGRSLRVEDYVGQLPAGPLAGEEGLELLRGPAVVQVRQAQRDKRAVPTPLVRVQRGGGLGPGLEIIASQDLGRRVYSCGFFVTRSDRGALQIQFFSHVRVLFRFFLVAAFVMTLVQKGLVFKPLARDFADSTDLRALRAPPILLHSTRRGSRGSRRRRSPTSVTAPGKPPGSSGSAPPGLAVCGG